MPFRCMNFIIKIQVASAEKLRACDDGCESATLEGRSRAVWVVPSLKLLPQKEKGACDCAKAYGRGDSPDSDAAPATVPVGTHATSKHAHRADCGAVQVPCHSAFQVGGHCHDARNRHLWLRAPDKPHERLADRAPRSPGHSGRVLGVVVPCHSLADPNGPAHAARRPTACPVLSNGGGPLKWIG